MPRTNTLENLAVNANGATWGVIHIFGYGETQIIGQVNGKVGNAQLSTIAPLISYLATLQNGGTTISVDNLFALDIANNMFINFFPVDKSQSIQQFLMSDVDQSYVNALVADVTNNL